MRIVIDNMVQSLRAFWSCMAAQKDNLDIMKIWCKDCRAMFSAPDDPDIFKHDSKHEIIFDFITNDC